MDNFDDDDDESYMDGDGRYDNFGDGMDVEAGGGGYGNNAQSSSRFSSSETDTQLGNTMYGTLLNPNVQLPPEPSGGRQTRSRSQSSHGSGGSWGSGGSGRSRRDVERGRRRTGAGRSGSVASNRSRGSLSGSEGGRSVSSTPRGMRGTRGGAPLPPPHLSHPHLSHPHQHSHQHPSAAPQGIPPPQLLASQRNDYMSYQNEQYYTDMLSSVEEREMDERITLISQYMRLCASKAANSLAGEDMLSLERKGLIMPGVRKFSDEELEIVPLARLKMTVYKLKRLRKLDSGVMKYKQWIVTGSGMFETILPPALALFLPAQLQPQLHGLSQRTHAMLRSGELDDELEVLYHRNSSSGPSSPYWALAAGIGGLIFQTHMDNYQSGNIKDHAFDTRDGFGSIAKLYTMFTNLTSGKTNPFSSIMGIASMFGMSGGGSGGSGIRDAFGVQRNSDDGSDDDDDEGGGGGGGGVRDTVPKFKNQADAASALQDALSKI